MRLGGDAPNFVVGEKLQEFLSKNGRPLKGWPFKEWGWRLVDNQMVFKMPNGIRITGEVLKEFLSLDHVNHYDSHLGKSRGEWVEMLIHSNDDKAHKYKSDKHHLYTCLHSPNIEDISVH